MESTTFCVKPISIKMGSAAKAQGKNGTPCQCTRSNEATEDDILISIFLAEHHNQNKDS